LSEVLQKGLLLVGIGVGIIGMAFLMGQVEPF
jgi:hypothetical protein